MGTAIIAASPVIRIVLPPTDGRAYVVSLPEPLASDLRNAYSQMAADHERLGFKQFTFDEWVESKLRDVVYGDGHPWPEERR